MLYCIYSSFIRPKTELENQSAKWVRLVGNADVSTSTYTCIDAVLMLKINSVDLYKYSIQFAIKMTLNFEKSTKITYLHKGKPPLFSNFNEKPKVSRAI